MAGNLEGETAVVTGASSGVGRATARALATEGANVVLAARRGDRLASTADELREQFDIEALAHPTDVRSEAEVEALIEAAVAEFGGLDVLVNNAGVMRGGAVGELSTDQYRTMIETNVTGVFFATRAALPHLRERSGHAVFVGSIAGQYPRSYNPVYAATKWWVRGFALSVEASAGPDGVAVTVVNPAEIRTGFGTEDGEPFRDRYDEGEAVEPAEVAEAIAFAATREGSTVSELDVYQRDKLGTD